jgi:hypothetical protein
VSNSTSEGCCGECFDFKLADLEKDLVFFYYAGENTIIVAFVKDGDLFFSISYDCGHNFDKSVGPIPVGGNVTNLQIAAKDFQFVIAFLVKDTETGKLIKKAISGWYKSEHVYPQWQNYYKMSESGRFCYKPCAVNAKAGRLNNVSLSFRKLSETDSSSISTGDGKGGNASSDNNLEESVDHNFYVDDNGKVCMDCNGHACVI